MTALPLSLITLVEKLHQEYVFVSLYKPLIRQSLQELNDSCEDLFRTLWINHALTHSLSKLLSYERISCAEWVESLNRASSVRFLDATASLPTSFSVERYGHLLGTLRDSPVLLLDIVRWADSKSMDVDWLVKDILNVLYGQCVFQRDHELALQFLSGLLEKHVNSCDAVGSLFVDTEPALSSALCSYSALIPEFKLFLVASLRDPLAELLLCNDYLEFDITKAGRRFQSWTGDSPRFLFGEDLDASCQTLARITNVLLDCISDSLGAFPASLKHLIRVVRSHAMARWPGTSAEQLRKPVSSLLFGIILSTPIVSPEVWGILPAGVVVNSAARYNLCQMMGIIQACGWSHNQQMYKVVKHVDVELFRSIVDRVDEGPSSGEQSSTRGIFPIVSGLRRNAYLASLDQLQNMANLVVTMLESLRASGSAPTLCQQLEALNAQGIGHSSHTTPYSSPSNSFSISDVSHSVGGASKSSSSSPATNLKPSGPRDGKKRSAKKEQKSQSAHSLNVISPRHAKLTIPKSTSGGELDILVCTEAFLSFQLPSEVLVLPFQAEADASGSTPLWDFNLLSEEEFMSSTVNCNSSESIQTTIPSSQEQATLPFQQASLPLQQASLPLQQASLPLQQASLPLQQATLPLQQASLPLQQATLPPTLPLQQAALQGTPHADTKPPNSLMCFLAPDPPVLSPSHSLNDSFTNNACSDQHIQDTGLAVRMTLDLAEGTRQTPIEGSSNSTCQTAAEGSSNSTCQTAAEGSSNSTCQTAAEGSSNSTHQTQGSSHNTHQAAVEGSDARLTSEDGDVSPSALVPRLPPPIPPRRTLSKNRPPRNIGSMIEIPSPERVFCSLRTTPKRRSQSGLENSSVLSPSRSSVSSEPGVQKNRDKVLAANTAGSSVLLGGIAGQSAQEFRRSAYCVQLSYKLRLVLQSSRTLLCAANLGGGGGAEGKLEEKGLQSQMVALLKGVLAQQGWMEEGLECGLVLETLRMVTPLSDAQLTEALTLVYDEAMKRASFVAYLVKSHQLFQGTKVQMKTAIDLANRAKSIRESVYVNFIVDKFLESEKDSVSGFLSALGGNSVSDEKVSIMEACIEAFSCKILHSPDLAGWSDTDSVLSCLEDHLFTLAYRHVFHPNGQDSDSLRDQIFFEHLCKLSNDLHPSQATLQIPQGCGKDKMFVTDASTVYHMSCPWVSAQQQLRLLQLYKSPRGKLRCIIQCCQVLISLLQYAKCGSPPGADDMFPVLVYVLIKANPPDLLSTIQYIKNFAEVNLKGEESYWWTQFSAAVEFSKTI